MAAIVGCPRVLQTASACSIRIESTGWGGAVAAPAAAVAAVGVAAVGVAGVGVADAVVADAAALVAGDRAGLVVVWNTGNAGVDAVAPPVELAVEPGVDSAVESAVGWALVTVPAVESAAWESGEPGANAKAARAAAPSNEGASTHGSVPAAGALAAPAFGATEAVAATGLAVAAVPFAESAPGPG